MTNITTPITENYVEGRKSDWIPSRNLAGLWHNGLCALRAQYYLRNAELGGSRVRVWGKLSVRNAGYMYVGNRAQIVSTITPTELLTAENGRLTIGERTYINYGCSIAAIDSVTIGPNCNIGTYVIIMDNQFHRLEPERRLEIPESEPIVIEENVWLGARVIVMPGVTIGAGSAVGAGSIVTRNIPPRSVAVGTPAKVIRSL